MNSGYALLPCTEQAARQTLERIREHMLRLWAEPLVPCEWHALCKIRATREYTLSNVNLSTGMVVLVLQGTKLLRGFGGDSTAQNTQWTVPAGGVVYLPPGQHLSVCNMPEANSAGTVEYHALTVNLDDTMLQQVRLRVHPQTECPAFMGGDSVSLLMLDALESFLNCLQENDTTLSRMQQEQLVYLMWKRGIPVFSTFNPLVRRIRALVEADPAHPWSTTQLADTLCMTERTLRRHLEKSGTSVAELVRLSRLHWGLGLLQGRNLSVSEVAARCGYTSQSRFAQRFREQFGVLPSKVQ